LRYNDRYSTFDSTKSKPKRIRAKSRRPDYPPIKLGDAKALRVFYKHYQKDIQQCRFLGDNSQAARMKEAVWVHA
jgi:hypothetical protein